MTRSGRRLSMMPCASQDMAASCMSCGVPLPRSCGGDAIWSVELEWDSGVRLRRGGGSGAPDPCAKPGVLNGGSSVPGLNAEPGVLPGVLCAGASAEPGVLPAVLMPSDEPAEKKRSAPEPTALEVLDGVACSLGSFNSYTGANTGVRIGVAARAGGASPGVTSAFSGSGLSISTSSSSSGKASKVIALVLSIFAATAAAMRSDGATAWPAPGEPVA